MRGKSTENEEATGSSICSKDSLSLSAKFFFLLSANSAFVFFLGPCFVFFSLSKDFFLFFLTRFTTLISQKEKRRGIKRRMRIKEKQNHM